MRWIAIRCDRLRLHSPLAGAWFEKEAISCDAFDGRYAMVEKDESL